MKYFLLLMAVVYAIGAVLHLMDIFDLRLQFSSMSELWKIWIVFLFIADTFAAIGLFARKKYGEYTFLAIALIQLIAYLGFSSVFGEQIILIGFHLLTLTIYVFIRSFTYFRK